MQEQVITGITNDDLIKIVGTLIVVHGATMIGAIYAAARFGLRHILEYHDLKRDVKENKFHQEVINEVNARQLEKLERDVNAAFSKIRTK